MKHFTTNKSHQEYVNFKNKLYNFIKVFKLRQKNAHAAQK